MNQQQLQIARSALWHQNAASPAEAALVTFDDAAPWLDEIGLCLFLPRHTQLPAPAPSFVEAVLGAASLTPPPAAIENSMALAARLIEQRRAIPLNLLGTASEQPDFLITPDVLPWAAAIRGDRQWKAAPGGRTAPIVLRTWEALDREGGKTAVELREILGRELTEAAVLRALIELWTSFRAVPAYTPGQPTRWSLLKELYPAQLATAANTSSTTALSALLSLYLRSAVAATAEEAEIFLSPLTARSRIREVVHGMTATRQFGATTVNSQTLLFIEGSLPEAAVEPEPVTPPFPLPSAVPIAPPRPPFRKEARPQRWEQRKRPPQREVRPPRREFRPASPPAPHPDEQHPAAAPAANQRPQGRKPRGEQHRGEKPPFRPAAGRSFGDKRRWQARDQKPRPRFAAQPGERRGSAQRPAPGAPRGRTNDGPREGQRPARPQPARPGFAGARPPRPPFPQKSKPWQRPASSPAGQKPRGSAPPPQNRAEGPGHSGEGRSPRDERSTSVSRPRPQNRRESSDRPRSNNRPPRDNRWRSEDRPARDSRPRRDATPAPGASRPPRSGPPRPGKTFAGKSFGAKRRTPTPGAARPGKPFSGKPSFKGSARPRPGAPARSSRPGSPPRSFRSGPSGRSSAPGRPPRAGKPPARPFRKPSPGPHKPRNNRDEKENPE